VGRSKQPAWKLTSLGRTLTYHLHEYDVQVRTDQIYQALDSLEICSDDAVLDVGCSDGQTLLATARYSSGLIMGVDADLEALRLAPVFKAMHSPGKKLPPWVAQGSAYRLPFSNYQFDRVICQVTLQYLYAKRVLAEMHLVMQYGGRAYLRVTSLMGGLRRIPNTTSHLRAK